MPRISEGVWITADKRSIPLPQMAQDHMEAAFLNLCTREYNAELELRKAQLEVEKQFNNLRTISRLKKLLLDESDRRNTELPYPDQKYNSTAYGKFFQQQRHVRTMDPVKAVVTTDRRS